MNTKIKAGAITNLTDARYFAAWGVEWIGFSLDSTSEKFVPSTTLQAIKSWIDGVKIVGEFGWQDSQNILEIAEGLQLDGIQLNMTSSISDAKHLQKFYLFKELVLEKDKKLTDYRTYLESFSSLIQCFILNFSKNGFTWEDIAVEIPTLRTLVSDFPILIQSNLQPNQMVELLKAVNPCGVHLLGGEEEQVGVKSFELMDEILEQLSDM